jgi:hypothetical protein
LYTQITLTDDTKENRAVREGRSSGREGPVAITLDFYQNFEKTAPLAWVKDDARSNFKFSDHTYQEIILAGKPAVRYGWSGLYEALGVVLAHKEYMLSISVTYLTQKDTIYQDFEGILKTVTFH